MKIDSVLLPNDNFVRSFIVTFKTIMQYIIVCTINKLKALHCVKFGKVNVINAIQNAYLLLLIDAHCLSIKC